jgi:transposase
MEQYAGIDVPLEFSSVCLVDAIGTMPCEFKMPGEPEALMQFF